MRGYNLSDILFHFPLATNIEPYGAGHINDTYLADIKPSQYILQRINHNVFKNPDNLMENIVGVTEHLRQKIMAAGGNPDRETLTVIKTKDGQNCLKTEDGNYFRVYLFVDHANTYQTAEKPIQFYNSARALGKFQRQLADYPAETLHETIPRFHDTRDRFEQLRAAITADKVGRAAEVKAEIDFALARENYVDKVLDAIKAGEVPLCVTHNDTKLNNFLFDDKTDEAVCVIDLDTVMPGSRLYDFGDSIRFGASTASEDEKDLSRVTMSLELFEAFSKGFLEEMSQTLTPTEIELLPFSAILLTFECGIRFLTDYLSGDTYFKIHRPEHNLDRCRTQLKLVADMEEKMNAMCEIVRKYV